MDVRSYLQVIRRHRWIVVLLLVLGLAAGAATHLATSRAYSAQAVVLLLPNDPAERVTESPGGYFDPDRYNAAQVGVMTSPAVAGVAAQTLGGGVSTDDVRQAVTVAAGQSTDLVTVSATAGSPRQSAAIADALADAYITYNRTTEVTALTAAAAGIQTQLDELTSQLTTLRDEGALSTDPAVQAVNTQYSTLYGKQQDLLIDASLKKGEAQVVSPAAAPASAEGLSLLSKTVLGGLLGLVVGLALAFLRDQLDDRVRSVEDVQALTGLPVLAELPEDRKSARKGASVLVDADPRGQFAESVRGLRSGLVFLSLDKSIRRLLVTSAVPGEGKTSVAVNLAATYAQAGLRTVIVSADLRRPTLETVFAGDDTSGPGLTGTLTSVLPFYRLNSSVYSDDRRTLLAATLDRSLVATSVVGLSLLPTGKLPPNPAELLGSTSMDDLLDLLEERFDLVVLDSPPILAVTDAAVLAPKAGSVLLVTSSGRSRRRGLRRSVDALANAHADLLGVVVNRSRSADAAVAYYGHGDSGTHGSLARPAAPAAVASDDRQRSGVSSDRPR